VIRFDGVMAPIEQGLAASDQVVTVGRPRLWSHRCSWDELAVLCDELTDVLGELDLAGNWPRRWTAMWRYQGDEVASAVRDLGCLPAARHRRHPAVIANRIRVYERDTVPLLAYYARRATVIHIDGARPEREVTDAVLRELAACA
jgi:adenylate kinase family enzyme